MKESSADRRSRGFLNSAFLRITITTSILSSAVAFGTFEAVKAFRRRLDQRRVDAELAARLQALANDPRVTNRPKPTVPPEIVRSFSHQPTGRFDVKGSEVAGRIQHFCLHPTGDLIAVVGCSRTDDPKKLKPVSELHRYSPTGERRSTVRIEFNAHAVAARDDGAIFVAGSGMAAKVTPTGSIAFVRELPNVTAIRDDEKWTTNRAKAEKAGRIARQRRLIRAFERRKSAMLSASVEENGRLSEIDSDDDLIGDRVYAAPSQLDSEIDSANEEIALIERRPLESFVAEVVARCKSVHAIAVDAESAFVTAGDPKGFGYSIFRYDLEFKTATPIIEGLAGCCGQLDVQIAGDRIVVAENTRHRVAVFNRSGEPAFQFGKQGRDGVGERFDSCCNPMNAFVVDDAIYTAESNGIIKRFDRQGRYQRDVGSSNVGFGCKNVAFAVDENRNRLYVLDYDQSAISVLEPIGSL
jgi:hypothetical protein